MELCGEEVVLLHRRTKRVNVFGYGCSILTHRHIEAVNEVDELPIQAFQYGES